jgi:hypothetical protein
MEGTWAGTTSSSEIDLVIVDVLSQAGSGWTPSLSLSLSLSFISFVYRRLVYGFMMNDTTPE